MAKVEAVVSTLGTSTAEAVRGSIKQTPMAGRLLDVEINTETRHAVAYGSGAAQINETLILRLRMWRGPLAIATLW